MDWYGNKTLHETPFKNMTINGAAVAAIQNVDNFSFAYVFCCLDRVSKLRQFTIYTSRRVFQAGHEVVRISCLFFERISNCLTSAIFPLQPAFQPQAAFEIFSQIVRMEQLHSV